MGILSTLFRPWQRSSPTDGMVTSWPILDYLWENVQGRDIPQLWKDQPHLRTVVGFLTRNVAQLHLLPYETDADGAKTPLTTGPLAKVLTNPNPDQTQYEFLEALVGDLALFDNAYVTVFATERNGDLELDMRLLRPSWVQAGMGMGPYEVRSYVVMYPETNVSVSIPAANVIHFHGWNPVDARVGVPPVTSLFDTLSEQLYAVTYRAQLWKRGGRVGTFLTRPADAPDWDPRARTKFKRDFANQWSGNQASMAGGVPLLEDGMELKRVGYSAHEEEFVEASKLSLTTVAAAYYVNPTMVGLLDNANYSNVREFRRMLYGETLGPVLEQIVQRLTARLIPMAGLEADGHVSLSFDVESRLRGSFEDLMKVASAAVGGPILTANEYRSQVGYPPIDGGDVLIKPLNITKPGDPDPVPAGDEDEKPEDDDENTGDESGASDTGKVNGHRVALAADVFKVLEGAR